jgi:DNA-directed RNA polymerase specialized sigma24 family protein
MDDGDGAAIPRRHVTELADFFTAHDRWLFGHACVRTQGDRELAADLVQDTFEAAAVAWAVLRGHPSGRQQAWLLSTLAHKDISALRRNAAFRRRQPITRAVASQGRATRNLVHLAQAIGEIAVVQRRLLRELGREPTPEELAPSSARAETEPAHPSRQPGTLQGPSASLRAVRHDLDIGVNGLNRETQAEDLGRRRRLRRRLAQAGRRLARAGPSRQPLGTSVGRRRGVGLYRDAQSPGELLLGLGKVLGPKLPLADVGGQGTHCHLPGGDVVCGGPLGQFRCTFGQGSPDRGWLVSLSLDNG